MAARGKVSRRFAKMPPPANAVEAWERDKERCWAMLDELENMPSLHGKVWIDGMLKHWEKKLKELIDSPPQLK